MANISTWSTTAASNNAATPDGWPEGQAPSTVNNCGREMMAAIRTWFEDAQWINFGHTPTRTGNTTFTIATDVTAIYGPGRRVKMTGGATIYATVFSSTYSAPNTTITVVNDSSNVPNPLTTVSVGILSGTSNAIPYRNTSSMFNAERITSAQALPQNVATVIIFNQENTDQSILNDYDTATGIFSCNAAGIYLFTANLSLQNNDSVSATVNSAYFSKNGASAVGSGGRFNMAGLTYGSVLSPASSAFGVGGSVLIKLASGDTVKVVVDVGAVDASSAFGVGIGSYFSGALV